MRPLIATLPARIIRRYAPMFGLAMSPVPIHLEVPGISMVWAAHADREPASQWLRSQIKPVISLFETPDPAVFRSPAGRSLHA